ncbi:MAG: methyltransferase domain-containing protein [Candidatus Lokiarchaeota archaeon]|nr:methyltransferase domain-containing protein [Candidatus Lokiarchaeota archaeon]
MSYFNSIKLDEISISYDGTHHLYKNQPLYKKRFKNVMSFHIPGIAAVEDELGAYHINIKGIPTYDHKFIKTFGYYENIAAVIDESGFYHIDINGKQIYNKRYDWVGNYQEKKCPVRNFEGFYYHIDTMGNSVYDRKYLYVGDFKHGIAVVYTKDGKAHHITENGSFFHNQKYEYLNLYHKECAIAKDSKGYFHVNKKGKSIYQKRFKNIEPYYNDNSLVLKKDNSKIIINKSGETIHEIYKNSLKNKENDRNKLMNMLIGYWKTQIIHSIVELEILDLINTGYDNFQELLDKTELPSKSLMMIIKVLKLWDFIAEKNQKYYLKPLGLLLTEDHEESLKYAALMWGNEHYFAMAELTKALKQYKPQFKKIYKKDFFQYHEENVEKGDIYGKAMSEYSLDYNDIIDLYDFNKSEIILDLGGGYGQLVSKILEKYSNIKEAIVFDLPNVIRNANKYSKQKKIQKKIKFCGGNFFEDIPIKADTIILSRVMHDWDDNKILILFKNIHNSLEKNGHLLIFETIVPENSDKDIGITLNFNLLVCVGGKERTFSEYSFLLNKAGFKIVNYQNTNQLISLILAQKTK